MKRRDFIKIAAVAPILPGAMNRIADFNKEPLFPTKHTIFPKARYIRNQFGNYSFDVAICGYQTNNPKCRVGSYPRVEEVVGFDFKNISEIEIKAKADPSSGNVTFTHTTIWIYPANENITYCLAYFTQDFGPINMEAGDTIQVNWKIKYEADI